MSKSLTASKGVMKTYLSELLTEPEVAPANELSRQHVVKKEFIKPVAHKENKSLERLLQTVCEPKEQMYSEESIITEQEVKEVDFTDVELLLPATENNHVDVVDVVDVVVDCGEGIVHD